MQSLPTIFLQLTGESPLLCHNGQTADPRNRYAKAMKAISSKRKKTDADLDELAKLEWQAGLYLSQSDIVIPDHVLESAFIGGAKKSKRGPQARTGLYFTKHASLDFDGKPEEINEASLDAMFESGQFTFVAGVRVGQAKVMRTRPIFRHWSLLVELQYDPDVLNLRDVEDIALDAGRQVGIGDWRPKHGRFSVAVVDPQALNQRLEQLAIA